MKNREAYFDQLRALAIFSIVCCHVCGMGYITKNPDLLLHFKTFYATMLFNSGRFIGVPLFIMLSGALLINKEYSLTTFVKKRFSRVIVPYIFWVIINILFSSMVQHKDLTPEFIFNAFFGFEGALWFIKMLIIVYIAIFIINKLLDYAKSKSYEKECINILVIASLICYVIYNLIHIPFEMISFSCLFIPYAIFGYYLTHTEFTNIRISDFGMTSNRIVISAFILSVVCYLYFVMTVCLKTMAMNKFFSASYFTSVVIILNFSIVLLFRYLPKSGGLGGKINGILTSNHIAKAILSISLCSYGIYFVHILILKYLEITYLYSLNYFCYPSWIPLLVAVVFSASWIVIWIMSKIPYFNKVSGAG